MDKKISSRAILGGVFFLANSLLIGCDQEPEDNLAQSQSGAYSGSENVMSQRQSGVMTEVEELGPDDYRITKEYPSGVTGVIVKRLVGSKEIIPEDKVPQLMERERAEKGMGLGSVLSAGLLGYMMGRNSSLSPYVYKDDSLYKQSLMNRELIYKQQEEQDKRRGYSGYWAGGRYYSSTRNQAIDTAQHGTAGKTKSGFFSRLASSFRSSG
jgi:hypothetical protein